MNNPCKDCEKSYYQQRCNECFECSDYAKYQTALEKRRKYRVGNKISTMADLASIADNSFIYVYGHLYHCGWWKSWQYRLVEKAVNSGVVYKADKK